MFQTDAFDVRPIQRPLFERGASHQERAEAFHEANPHVLSYVVELIRKAQRRGDRKIGMGMIFEVLRWEYRVSTTGEEFRLNHNHRAWYTRKVQAEHPELSHMLDTRAQRNH